MGGDWSANIRPGGRASLELLGLMAASTSAVEGLAPGLPLAAFIEVFSLQGPQLLLLHNFLRGFIFPIQMSDQESGLWG